MNEEDSTDYFSAEMSTFGDRVAAARRALGLTQDQMAAKLGIKLKTLHAWEDDISEPRANKLQMLAGLLNVSIIWLLTGEGEGVNDPWNQVAENASDIPDLVEVISEIRGVRSEYARLGERLARLEKRLVRAGKPAG